MAARVGSMFTELTVDASGLVTGLGRAGSRVDGFERDTNQRLGRIDRGFGTTFARIGSGGTAAFLSMAKGAALALAPILSVSAALGTARAALDQFSAIADNAKSTGLDAEVFQALAYQAEQSGVAFETFAKGLETFAKNSGLAVVGKGRMLTALKALNPELLANIQAATTQEQRVRLAADAIAAQGDAAKRAALSTALFGDAGAKLSDAFAGGAAQIDATAVAARKLGLVVDRDLIAKSEELGDELSTATQVMNLQFQQALVDLAPILVATAQLAGNLAAAINYMSESMQGLENRSTARLEQDYEALTATLDQANATYAPGVVGNMGVQIDPEKQAAMQAEADAMRAELKRRAIQKLATDLNKPKFEPFDPGGTGGGGRTRNAAADATIRQAESVKALIANLEHEQAQLGRSAEAQEYFNLLKQAGVISDSEFGQAIAATLAPLQSQRSAIEANAKAMEAFQSLASDTLKGFVADLQQGKTFTEALSASFGRLADRLIDMAMDAGINMLFKNLMGAFGGGSFIGGTSGAPALKLGFQTGIPGYAVGTDDHPGGLARVFERGAEIIDLPKHTRVIPHELSKGMASAQATMDQSTAGFTYAPSIDARGADAGAVARLEKVLARQAAELESKIIRVLQSGPRGRFKTAG